MSLFFDIGWQSILPLGKICHQKKHELAGIHRFYQNICKSCSLVETDIIPSLVCRVTDYRRFHTGLAEDILEPLKSLHTVHTRHTVVEEDQIVPVFTALIQTFLTAAGQIARYIHG